MAFIDDYIAATDSLPFRQRVGLAVSRVVMEAVAAQSPPPEYLNLARKFMLSPEGEVTRYLLPIAARLVINAVTVNAATDAQILTATQQVLAVNVQLGIGVSVP
jgi:hypothetical protein